MVSIYFLNARLKAANDQYALVEKQLQLANQREQEAKVASKLAKAEQDRAEQALAEMQRAISASEKAQEQSEQGTVETQADHDSRDEAMPFAIQPEDARATRELQAQKSPPPTVEPSGSTDPSSGSAHEAQQAMLEASRIYDRDFSQSELRRLDKTPDEVVGLLVKAMDSVSRALAAQPDFAAAWMLKGRLHLALMEFDRAIESFREAVKFEESNTASDEADSAGATLELATTIGRAGSDKFGRAADVLRSSSLPQNQTAGIILQFLNEKPALRNASSGSPGPLRRQMTANEAALELIQGNGAETRVFVRTSGGRVDVIIWGSPEMRNLKALLEIDLAGLAVIGARTIDWQTILSLPVDSLDFSKCPIESLPQTQRGFLRVRSLTLADSEVASVEFARGMPLLETLDLSSTHVTDLSPLLACRRLRHLDLAGLNPADPRTLLKLPIESLTVSPMLITDRQGAEFAALSSHSQEVCVLRTILPIKPQVIFGASSTTAPITRCNELRWISGENLPGF